MANFRLAFGSAAGAASNILASAAKSARERRARIAVATNASELRMRQQREADTQLQGDITTLVDGALGQPTGAQSGLNATDASAASGVTREELINRGVAIRRQGGNAEDVAKMTQQAVELSKVAGDKGFQEALTRNGGDVGKALEDFKTAKAQEDKLAQNMSVITAFPEKVKAVGGLDNISGIDKALYFSALEGAFGKSGAKAAMKQVEANQKQRSFTGAVQKALFRDGQTIDYSSLSNADRTQIISEVASELVDSDTSPSDAFKLAKDIVKTRDRDVSPTGANYAKVYNSVIEDTKEHTTGKFEVPFDLWKRGVTPSAGSFKEDIAGPKKTKSIRKKVDDNTTVTITTSGIRDGISPSPESGKLQITKGEWDAAIRGWERWYRQEDGSKGDNINQSEFQKSLDEEFDRLDDAFRRVSAIRQGEKAPTSGQPTRQQLIDRLSAGGATTNALMQPLLEGAK